jgi:hypothetical protein
MEPLPFAEAAPNENTWGGDAARSTGHGCAADFQIEVRGLVHFVAGDFVL